MFKERFFQAVCAMFVWCSAISATAGERVSIFAASSLKTVLDQIAPTLPADVVIAYGGSAALARQIAQGAEADMIILAHPQWMDWAENQGAIDSTSRCDLVSNRLVVVAPEGTPSFAPRSSADMLAALAGGRLAMGHMQSVPAGQYAAAWLDGQGWLADLRPHLAEAQNVRIALALVARGETPLGVVYRSDAFAEPRVDVVYLVPEAAHPKIQYPMALTPQAQSAAAGVAQAIAQRMPDFAAAGFEPLPPGAPGGCS